MLLLVSLFQVNDAKHLFKYLKSVQRVYIATKKNSVIIQFVFSHNIFYSTGNGYWSKIRRSFR